MVTDHQVRLLMKHVKKGKKVSVAAAKAGMDPKTARKYLKSGQVPSEMEPTHTWRTREDPFSGIWEEVRAFLKVNQGTDAKSLFKHFQEKCPGRFPDGQLRTLQRRVKVWRALEGPAREVFFPQKHYPGALGQSDFTYLTSLGVTIGGEPFPHMLYHFVLTYSNWETGTVCFSESFESLAEGLQKALWELGGVPMVHQTDRLSSAVSNLDEKREFTERYEALLRHYGLEGRRSQAGEPHENGDIEQRHYRFKRAMDQAFIFRGSRDFADRKEYEAFIRKLFTQLNAGRQERLKEELAVLRDLPALCFAGYKKMQVRVGPSSTIRVNHNTYSLHSRLRGEMVDIRLHAEHLEIWYGQKKVDDMPRLRGEGQHRINYRHIIDSLVRKPGAFENYRYRDELFPTSRFRIAYDLLKSQTPHRASREYLQILHLAAKESETGVDHVLRVLIDAEKPVDAKSVKELFHSGQKLPLPTDVVVEQVDLSTYDQLLNLQEVAL
jgi:hypothetical protein